MKIVRSRAQFQINTLNFKAQEQRRMNIKKAEIFHIELNLSKNKININNFNGC